MPAPLGNSFWQDRQHHGRRRRYAHPDRLWDACHKYFTWVDEHPLIETRAFAYLGNVTVEPIPKMRAMTIAGLCISLGIARSTWTAYSRHDDFSPVTTRAEEIVRTQKFEGAAAGLLKANIIAYELHATRSFRKPYRARGRKCCCA